MRFFFRYIASLWGEIFILLLFLFVSSNYLDDRNDLIQADGRGYYEYLPATFIYHDLQLDYLDTLKSEFYDNQLMAGDFYPRLDNGKRFDKYFVGTAVLQLPFFLVGHSWALASDQVADGFSRPYQISIYVAALFYTFFGLLFMRLLLVSYDVNRFWILLAQLGVIFCSSIMHYMRWDISYSHVYSFFLVSAFLYFARNFLLTNHKKSLFWTIIFLGLIFLVRPVNVIVLLFVPILAENTNQLVQSFRSLLNIHLKILLIAVIIVVLICQVQCVVWYFQTGNWFYYAYGDEGFNWSDPRFVDFLFSYKKGFFLWAPWFFILVISSLFFHVLRKMWFRFFGFLFAFLLLVYVLSSWWFWSYGGSFGSRPMIEFYPALIAFAAPMFSWKSGFLKWLVLLSTPIFCYVAVTQTYQYQRFILLYDGMDKESYWKVFLKKELMYELYLWSREIETGELISETDWVKNQKIPADRWFISDTLTISNPTAHQPKVGQITFVSNRKSNAESLEIRLLDVNDSLLFNHYNCMLHAVDESRGDRYLDYRFEIGVKLPPEIKAVFLINTKEVPVTIDSMKIRFFAD